MDRINRIAVPIIVTLALAASLASPSPVAAGPASAGLDTTLMMYAFDTTVGVEWSGTVASFLLPPGITPPAAGYRAVIRWGDNTISRDLPLEGRGTGGTEYLVRGTHTYDYPGRKPIRVAIVDPDTGRFVLQGACYCANASAGSTTARLRDAQGNTVGTAKITPRGDTSAQVGGRVPGVAAPVSAARKRERHLVEVEVDGLPPGTHEIHLHEKGSCEGSGSSGNSLRKRGELTVGPDRTGAHNSVQEGLSLAEGEDRLLDEDGAAIGLYLDGQRIACGVLPAANIPDGAPDAGAGGSADRGSPIPMESALGFAALCAGAMLLVGRRPAA